MKLSILIACGALALTARGVFALGNDRPVDQDDVIAVPAGPAVQVGPAVPAQPVPMPLQPAVPAPLPMPQVQDVSQAPAQDVRAAIDELNAPLRTGHEPTPEDAVRAFVRDLNKPDLQAACSLVVGADYNDKAKKEAAAMGIGLASHLFLIGDMHVYGDPADKRRATVTFSLTDVAPHSTIVIRPGEILNNAAPMALGQQAQGGGQPNAALPADAAVPAENNFPVTVERLHMFADRDGWLIMPDAALRPGAIRNRQEDTVAYTASLLVGRDPGEISKMQHDMEVCQANLKALGAAASAYLQDTAGDFAFKAADFHDALQPYIKNDAIFNCPLVVVGDDSYAFNPNFQDVPYKTVTHPELTVLLYEGANMKLDFRHDGKANVCFADGHVSYIRPEEEAQLKWKP